MSHRCHWPSCNVSVLPKLWGCSRHWFTLPKPIRDRIWATYVPGQEERKDPTDAYMEAAKAAHDWAVEYEKKHGVVKP